MAEISNLVPGEKPVLALGVDGVFIVTSQEKPDGYMPIPGTSHEFYNPEHAGWLRNLSEDFDPVYVSGHGMHAHRDMRELYDIPEFDWVNFRLLHKRVGDINSDRRAALSTYFEDREIAWVDDELRYTDIAWARFRSLKHKATAVIRPDSHEGLQRKHIEQLRIWLGTLAAGKN